MKWDSIFINRNKSILETNYTEYICTLSLCFIIRLIKFVSGVKVMVFNATFNNISAISWRFVIKWRKWNTTLSEQFQNPIKKIAERDKIKTANTQIHDRSHSWIGTGNSIKKKVAGLNYFYGPQWTVIGIRTRDDYIFSLYSYNILPVNFMAESLKLK